MKLLQARVKDELYFTAKEQAVKERLNLGEFFAKVIEEYLKQQKEVGEGAKS